MESLESFFEYISAKAAESSKQAPESSALPDELNNFLQEFLKRKATPSVKFEKKKAIKQKLAPVKERQPAVKQPKDGRTPILRKSDDAIEWKYSDEKDWRVLVDLDDLREKIPTSSKENFEERFNTSDLLGGGGHGAVPEFKVEDNVFYWKLSISEEWQELFELPSPGGVAQLEFTDDDDAVYWRADPDDAWQLVFEKENSMKTKRIDMVDDYIYTGEAEVGTSEASALWRISRTYIAPGDGDVIVVWAEGNSNFDNAWADHLILSYS